MISQRWPDNFREVMKYEFGISIHGPTDPWQAANRWEAHFSSPARAVWTRARGFGLQRNYYTAWKQREVATVSRRCPLGNKGGIAFEFCVSRMRSKQNEPLIVLISLSPWCSQNPPSSNIEKWIQFRRNVPFSSFGGKSRRWSRVEREIIRFETKFGIRSKWNRLPTVH